jgi:predicted permease
MNIVHRLHLLFNALFRRDSFESTMSDEMRFHIDAYVDDLIRAGMGRKEAVRRARIEFGSVDAAKDECRQVRGLQLFDELRQNIHYAFRGMRRNPAFTAVVIVTFALGIGANTAIFSVIAAALLRPLPFPDPERLIAIESVKAGAGPNNFAAVSPADLRDWSEQSAALDIAAYSGNGMTLRENDQVETIYSARITQKFFDVLAVHPMLGRTFEADEWLVKGPRAVVLSRSLWLRRFGGDPSIVGKRLKTGETVIGVMPDGFKFPARAEAWTPIYNDTPEMNRRASRYLLAIGRVRPHQSINSAASEMKAISARLASTYPTDDRDWNVQVSPLAESLVRGFRPALLMLMGAVGLVLLIACANVSGLMLARATGRNKELTVRLAVGADRWRLIRQFIVEGLILSAFGAAAGLVLARWTISGLFGLLSNTSWTALASLHDDVHINGAVILFMAFVSIASGLLFGLIPLIGASQHSIMDPLRQTATQSGSYSEHRIHKLLVIVEFACAVVLLAGAGLLIHSFIKMQNVDYGYERRALVVMPLPQPQIQNPEVFREQALQAVNAVPGIESAALMSFTYFGALNIPFNIEGNPLPTGDVTVRYSSVTADYFRVLKARLIAGREFNEADSSNAPGVAIINQTMARQYFPGEDPIGKKIVVAVLTQRVVRQIVGVVVDIRQEQPMEPIKPEIFVHWPQLPWLAAVLAMRIRVDPPAAEKAVQQAIGSVDKTLPPSKLQTVDSMLSDQVAEPRLYLVVLGAFAAIAVLLAVIGIYGMLNYIVNRGIHDMAVRIAVGARASDVVKLVVSEGMVLSITGIALGLAGAAALTRVMKSLLFGITATDPMTFVVVALLLLAAAFLASYIPAHRASRVDPTIALRYE